MYESKLLSYVYFMKEINHFKTEHCHINKYTQKFYFAQKEYKIFFFGGKKEYKYDRTIYIQLYMIGLTIP